MRSDFLRATALPALLLIAALCFGGCAGKHDNHHAGMHGGHGTSTPQKPSRITWHDFDEGKERAIAENKLMVVDFWVGEGCHRCDVMAMKIWRDPKVVELMEEHFIAVRVDIERALPEGARALGKKYDYNYECLLVLCTPDGNAVEDSTTGRMCFSELITAEWFVSYLKQAAGIDDDFFSDME